MSNTLIKDLADKRKGIFEEAKALIDATEAEGRDFDAAEQERYDRMTADLNSIRSRIDRLNEAADTEAQIAESYRSLGVVPGGGDGRPNLGDEFRKLAKGQIERIDLDARSWGNAWKRQGEQQRALSKGTAAAGGNTVPITFHDQIVQHMVDTTSMLALGPTILNTQSGENIPIPTTLTFGAATLVAEAGTIGGTDPTFGQRQLGAYKYPQLVLAAKELVDDAIFDIESFIARAAGINIGLALGADLISGNGASKPSGVLQTATLGVTGGAGVTGKFTADDLIDLQYSVISPYRSSPSAGWLVKDATLGLIRKLKDGSGRYLFDIATGSGAPDTFDGKPIKSDANMPGVALSAKSVAFGDFSRYFVRFAGGVRFERSTDFKFDTDQVAFRCIVRADGMLVDQAGAVKYFTGNAA